MISDSFTALGSKYESAQLGFRILGIIRNIADLDLDLFLDLNQDEWTDGRNGRNGQNRRNRRNGRNRRLTD